MEIKVIGSSSSNRTKLLKNINKVINKFSIKTKPIINDNNKINGYNINNTPALIINGVLVSQGSCLSEREITRFIKIMEN